jgi:hypothetical protein
MTKPADLDAGAAFLPPVAALSAAVLNLAQLHELHTGAHHRLKLVLMGAARWRRRPPAEKLRLMLRKCAEAEQRLAEARLATCLLIQREAGHVG